MIAIINYGLGNLHSVHKAVSYVGGEALVTADPQVIAKADKVILPGVGAFADGMKELKERGLTQIVDEVAMSGKPILGICLGMQLMFEESEEQGTHQGLGLLKGSVKRFTQTGIKVPQIGWNQLELNYPSRLMDGLANGAYVYFNHGYYCAPEDPSDVLTVTTYGTAFASSVQRQNIYGVQFHPEKSQKNGLQIIRNFVEL